MFYIHHILSPIDSFLCERMMGSDNASPDQSPSNLVIDEPLKPHVDTILSTRKSLILVGVIVTAVVLTVSVAFTKGQEIQQSIRNLSIAGLAAVAAISSIIAAIRTPEGRAYRRLLIVFSIGILCWLAAESIWNYYFFVLGVDIPYPSLSDVFYLAGYLPIGYFLYKGNKKLSQGAYEEDNLIATATTITIVAFIINIFLLEIVQASLGFSGLSADDLILLSLSISYPILDGVLSVPVIMILYNAIRNKVRSFTWTLLAASFLVTVVADTGFGATALVGLEELTENPVWDVMYAILYILVAAAMVNEMFARPEKSKALIGTVKSETQLLPD